MNNTGGSRFEPGKMFVGGLSWDTTSEGLKAYFSQFGEVTDSTVMKDPASNKPRGFGFVTFRDPACVNTVMAAPTGHTLDNKKIDPKPATVKNATEPGVGPVRKIFIGGLKTQTTEETVREYFMTYGNVLEVDLKYDVESNRMRGFGFVGFDNEAAVEQCCQIHFHDIDGKRVECKRAEPRNATGGVGAKNVAMTPAGGYGQNYPQGYGSQAAAYSAYAAATGYGYYSSQQQPQQQQQQQPQQQQQYYGYGQQSYGQYYPNYQTATGQHQMQMAAGQMGGGGYMGHHDSTAAARSAYGGGGEYDTSQGVHAMGGGRYDGQAQQVQPTQMYHHQGAETGEGQVQNYPRSAVPQQHTGYSYGSH